MHLKFNHTYENPSKGLTRVCIFPNIPNISWMNYLDDCGERMEDPAGAPPPHHQAGGSQRAGFRGAPGISGRAPRGC